MSSISRGTVGLAGLMATLLVAALAGVPVTAQAAAGDVPLSRAQSPGGAVRVHESQPYHVQEHGIGHPSAVAYLDGLAAFAVTQKRPRGAKVLLMDVERDRPLGRARVDALADPDSLAHNGRRILAAIDGRTFYTWPVGARGPVQARTRPVVGVRVRDARGMAYDPATRRWLVLDRASMRIVELRVRGKKVRATAGASLSGLGSPSGIAFDVSSGRLYVGVAKGSRIVAFSPDGERVAVYETSDVDAAALTSFSIGRTADPTDGVAAVSLYAVDRGDRSTYGRVAELSLASTRQAAARASTTSMATLVRATPLSELSPPSPDSSGIAYMKDRDRLLIADSEVDEMPLYAGVNMWQLSRDGSQLLDTGTTLKFSREPSGIAYDPQRKRVFVSDDNKERIFEITTGPDNRFGTADDPVGYFSTTAFGNGDPEDVTYDTASGDLFITHGVGREVYRISAGSNGRFDGVPPTGDDTVSHFDVAGYGSIDLEGVGYSPTRDSLFLADRKFGEIMEVSKAGALIQTIDIEAIGMKYPAGIALAPASDDPTRTNLYVVTRGLDNNKYPDENDGMLYELSAPNLDPVGQNPNTAPVVDAGPDLAVTLPAGAVLDATVTDDGLPNPPGFTTKTWSMVSGPGTVSFADAQAVDTTATFSAEGTYVLRLSVGDSELTSSDDVTVVVSEPVPTNSEPTVSAGPDKSVTLPASASLQGLVSDDGYPDPPGQTTVTWTRVSGPGTVTFSAQTSTATLASFSAAGTYVLRLTADDTELTAADETTITVAPPPPAGNLVKNSGFELDLTGWKGSSGTTLTRVSDPHSGSWAGRLVNTASSSTTCRLNDSPNWVETSLPATYTSSAWVKGDAASVGETVRLRLREYDGQDLAGTAEASVALSTQWQELVLTYDPQAPGSSTIDLNLIRASTGAGALCFVVDDVVATTD